MNTQNLILFTIKNVVPIVLVLIVFFRVILPVLTIVAHIFRLLLILVRDLLALIVKMIQKLKNVYKEKDQDNITIKDQAKVFGY
jgi:hypothetical protein